MIIYQTMVETIKRYLNISDTDDNFDSESQAEHTDIRHKNEIVQHVNHEII